MSDERIFIKKSAGRLYAYNAPYFGNDTPLYPRKAILKKIFFIGHAKKDYIYTEKRNDAFIKLIKNCFFINLRYNNTLERNIKMLDEIIQKVPCCSLGFTINSRIFKNWGAKIK